MSENTILNSLPESKTDWVKIKQLTDAQIESICYGDDDVIFVPKDCTGKKITYPNGIIIHTLPVEQKIDSWLREHNLQADKVAAALLKQFVEAQSEIK
ncbi:MAG: hypothetical protein AABY33_10495 [Pseudomonadota bacterium]